ISTASSVSSTAGTTQAGWTRYRIGRITCRNATTMIARATGHQRSPRSAAGRRSIPGGATGFRWGALLPGEPGAPRGNPAAETVAVARCLLEALVMAVIPGFRPGGGRAGFICASLQVHPHWVMTRGRPPGRMEPSGARRERRLPVRAMVVLALAAHVGAAL